MTAYVVAHLRITDPEAFEAYRARVPEVIRRYGGRYLIRGGRVHPLEGEWPVERLVVLQFDSVDAARAFYDSPDYAELIPLRQAGSEGTLAIVEGVD
jgi:uncharacterized protein (DUF1330 family)